MIYLKNKTEIILEMEMNGMCKILLNYAHLLPVHSEIL